MDPTVRESLCLTGRIIDLSETPAAVVEGDQVIVTEYVEANMLDNMTVQFLTEERLLQDHLVTNKMRNVNSNAIADHATSHEQPEPPSPPKQFSDFEVTGIKRLEVPRKVDPDLYKLWKKTLDDGDKVICPVDGCTSAYASISGIRNHYLVCKGESKVHGTFRCDICGLDFNYERLLKRHTTLVHTANTEDQLIETLEDAVRCILPEATDQPEQAVEADEFPKEAVNNKSEELQFAVEDASAVREVCDTPPKKRGRGRPKKNVDTGGNAESGSSAIRHVVLEQKEDSDAANPNYQIVGFVPSVEGQSQQISVICDGNVVQMEVPQTNGTDSDLIYVHWEVPVALKDALVTMDAVDGVQWCNNKTTQNVTDASVRGGRGRGTGRGRGRGRGGARRVIEREREIDETSDVPPPPKEPRYSRRRGLRSSYPDEIYSSVPEVTSQPPSLPPSTPVLNADGIPQVKKRRGRARIIDATPRPVENVKCGVCLDEFNGMKKFEMHAMHMHNGIARPYGHDQTYTPTEQRRALQLTLKKVGRIRCPGSDCNHKTFTTLGGYLYHERGCGKEDRRLECELCGKVLLPESLQNHMRTFHPPTPPPGTMDDDGVVLGDDDDVYRAAQAAVEEGATRTKRAAAKKALRTVSKFVEQLGTRRVDDDDDDDDYPNDVDGEGDDGSRSDGDGDFILEMAEGDEEMELDDDDDAVSLDGLHDGALPERLYSLPSKVHVTKSMYAEWREELRRDGNWPCRNTGCDYVGDNMKKVENHYRTCSRSQHGGLYTCLVCQYRTSLKAKILGHVQSHRRTHGRPSARSMEYLSCISMPEELKKRRSCKMPAPLRVYKGIRCGEFASKFFAPYYDHAALFFTANYARMPDVLFADWRSVDWKPLPPLDEELRRPYLPKYERSVTVRCECVAEGATAAAAATPASADGADGAGDDCGDCRTLGLFEYRRDHKTVTCFAGGPVWALAWCPTPHELPGCRQYAAVACHADADATHTYGDSRTRPGLIQIWDFGCLEVADDDAVTSVTPRLAFGICHDHGTVWSIVWCPSGCWEDPSSEEGTPRLGLMAVAFSDGLVRIYSIPHPHSLQCSPTSDDRPVSIFIGRPSVVLELNDGFGCSPAFQATTISWLQSAGHRLVAVGYTNGFIGVYDLSTESPLLRESTSNEPLRIMSCQAFLAHGSVVTGLDFAHGQGGDHLVSVGRDRCLKFWDLRDTSLPYNVVKKAWFTCASWMPHWCGACVSSDDALSLVASGTSYYECGYYGENSGTLLSHNANVWDACPSYWLNSIASCDDGGEVAICVMGQLMQLYASLKSANYRRLPLYRMETRLKSNENTDPKPRTYEEASRCYDVDIKDQPIWDFTRISLEEIKRVSNDVHMLQSAVDGFPLTSVNRIAWNPNLGSHLWIASGCQSGLFRLIHLGGMKDVVPVERIRSKLVAERCVSNVSAEN